MAIDLKPDIVIDYVKMPVMDGITAAEQIGKRAHLPRRHAHGVQPDPSSPSGPATPA